MRSLPLCLLVMGSFWGSLSSDAYAAVIINEVAWMGGVASPNHEWIELYNTGSGSESLDGWVLSDGGSLTITLSGQLAGGSYGVLERSSDVSAPGTAFLIYTGALVNTGATLTLKRTDGQIEDQVAGGENWGTIGGDNATKATAQYTSSGWRTGSPTPGSLNIVSAVTVVDDPPDDENGTEVESGSPPASATTGTATVVRTVSSRSKATPLIPATTELTLTIIAQEVAYVNQAVTFTALPKGIGKTIIASLNHTWNFGDLSIASGTNATHMFRRAGTYIVTHHASFGRHDVVARKEITVLPVTMALSFDDRGELLLHNNAAYDIDVSGYRVNAGGMERTFPAHSLVMAKQTLPLPFTRAKAEAATLHDNRNVVVAQTGEAVDVMTIETSPPPSLSGSGYRAVVLEDTTVVAPDYGSVPSVTTMSTPAPLLPDPQSEISDRLGASVSTANDNPTLPWAYVLLGLLILAVIGILFMPSRREPVVGVE